MEGMDERPRPARPRASSAATRPAEPAFAVCVCSTSAGARRGAAAACGSPRVVAERELALELRHAHERQRRAPRRATPSTPRRRRACPRRRARRGRGGSARRASSITCSAAPPTFSRAIAWTIARPLAYGPSGHARARRPRRRGRGRASEGASATSPIVSQKIAVIGIPPKRAAPAIAPQRRPSSRAGMYAAGSSGVAARPAAPDAHRRPHREHAEREEAASRRRSRARTSTWSYVCCGIKSPVGCGK